MGMLGNGLGKITHLGSGARESAIAKLIAETQSAQRGLMAEAKTIGIELSVPDGQSYYGVLGIRYTNDQDAIKGAYVRMAKAYHPDVNRDVKSTRRMEQINEAYTTLIDRKSKAEYDARLSKGAGLSAQSIKKISSEIINRYDEVRSKDFEEFNKRVSMPQYMDSISAAIDEVTDWGKKFNKIVNRMFGKYWDYGTALRRLQSSNSRMLKGESDPEMQRKLRENLARLDQLVKSYSDCEKGISAVINDVKNEVATHESSITARLRGSIQ